MNIGVAFFRSRVGRRIFFMFILSALLPIIAMAVISYVQVAGQLRQQEVKRLQSAAKAHGMSVYERFVFIETDMDLFISTVLNGIGDVDDSRVSVVMDNRTANKFEALALMNDTGAYTVLHGAFDDFPGEIKDAFSKNDEGKTVLFFQDRPGLTAAVYMARKLLKHKDETDSGIIIGKIDASFLWGIGSDNILPPMTDLCIVSQTRDVLVSSFPVTEDLLHRVSLRQEGENSRFFEYASGDNDYYVSFWPMFLKSRFNAQNLSVVLRGDRSDIMTPIAEFKKIFPLVVLLSLWVVLFLSLYYIRKSLVPLEKLKEGTLHVAQRDFTSRVDVTSGDEFEDLAHSFNSMSRQLGRQFDALMTTAEIDRAILSSLSTRKIISTALECMYSFFSCSSISLCLSGEKHPDTFHAYRAHDVRGRKTVEEVFGISPEEKRRLIENPEYIFHDMENGAPGYLPDSALVNMRHLLVLPLFLNEELKGIVSLGHHEKRVYSEDDLKHARQIANQLSIALANATLVRDLEKLNIGTLEALARTVDAKSNWTAGHSERVTELALKIGGVMGLGKKDLETLQRAAFLHDIGKIGIPLSVLDKPGKLTDEEFDLIKEHPLIGARILEPIDAYEDALSIVLQHHERFDGKGYPYGTAGEDIVPGARILAVADVYDAIISDRPYRQGWVQDKVVNLIKEESGSHFDPAVVDAFLVVMS